MQPLFRSPYDSSTIEELPFDAVPGTPPDEKRNSLTSILELGRAVAAQFASAPDPRQTSFRRLAGVELAGHAPSSLWRAHAIHRLAERYPELEHYEHLGVSHLSVALGVRDPERIDILREAEQQRWSRRRLEFEVRSRNPHFKKQRRNTAPAGENN